MFDYLVDHALKNVWCSPRQDLQVIFEPAMISSVRGTHTRAPHMWGNISLPTLRDQYYLYQIGQLHPRLVGLFPARNRWIRASDMMESENLIFDVYTNSGKKLARFETWVLMTQERNLLIAVKDQRQIADLRTDPLYIRLYSNSYFASDRADPLFDQIQCKGRRVVDAADALAFQRDYHLLRDSGRGYTTFFVNGVYVDDYRPSDVRPGDIVEYVYDSTVKKVVDLLIGDCGTFDSLLDSKRKYLLHYAGEQAGGVGIDYRDDIDVYLIKKTNAGRWDGVYYHKNQNDALRMVTHRDYSIVVPYVLGYTVQRPNWTDVNTLTVRLMIRNSGYQRPLMNEHHRIKELYKLDESDIVSAMLGIDASVPVWHAAALENSYYPKIMDAYSEDVDTLKVQYGYGYNAISKIVADSPLPVENSSGRQVVKLPYGLQVNSTLFEYDANGFLLGYHHHVSGAEYSVLNAGARLVEGVVGRGGFRVGTTFNQQIVTLLPNTSYRFYMTQIQNGVVRNNQWQDVTGDPTKYSVSGNSATWLVDLDLFAVAVRSDRDFVLYDLNLEPNNGLLKFGVRSEAIYPGGPVEDVVHIPYGNVDVWLNGKALVEGLDFIVKWPEVVIVNKSHLVPGNVQKVTVRASSFCKSDMTMLPIKEYGFVRYGHLSRNDRFNVRDDKVTRIVVNGRVFSKNQLEFIEDEPVLPSSVPNGSPYVIEDVVVPINGLVDNQDTYSLRERSLLVDTAVENYLTLKLPEPVPTVPDQIIERYAVYSPFCSTIMYDMINGVISMDNFKGFYADNAVLNRLTSYEYLLEYDPVIRGVDTRYVNIHPHNLVTETILDIYQYKFLERVIRLYLDNKVDLTSFVSIKPGLI